MPNIQSDKLQCRIRSTKYQILPKIIKIDMLMTIHHQNSHHWMNTPHPIPSNCHGYHKIGIQLVYLAAF